MNEYIISCLIGAVISFGFASVCSFFLIVYCLRKIARLETLIASRLPVSPAIADL